MFTLLYFTFLRLCRTPVSVRVAETPCRTLAGVALKVASARASFCTLQKLLRRRAVKASSALCAFGPRAISIYNPPGYIFMCR